MAEVLAISIAFPTVIFTVVLALALLYWLFVILGALDLDFLGGGDAAGHLELEGVAKGGLEGAAKGIFEGAAKGAAEGLIGVDGAADGVADGAADGAADGMADDAPEGFSGLFSALRLNRAPATVVLTLIAVTGWLTSVITMLNLGSLWTETWKLPFWILGILVFFFAIVVSLPLTSLAIRPLGSIFIPKTAPKHKDFVGRVCVISTGRVDSRFGQALLDSHGHKLILNVRCDTTNALKRGDQALIVSWDDSDKTFNIEPMDEMLADPKDLVSSQKATPSAEIPLEDHVENAAQDQANTASKT